MQNIFLSLILPLILAQERVVNPGFRLPFPSLNTTNPTSQVQSGVASVLPKPVANAVGQAPAAGVVGRQFHQSPWSLDLSEQRREAAIAAAAQDAAAAIAQRQELQHSKEQGAIRNEVLKRNKLIRLNLKKSTPQMGNVLIRSPKNNNKRLDNVKSDNKQPRDQDTNARHGKKEAPEKPRMKREKGKPNLYDNKERKGKGAGRRGDGYKVSAQLRRLPKTPETRRQQRRPEGGKQQQRKPEVRRQQRKPEGGKQQQRRPEDRGQKRPEGGKQQRKPEVRRQQRKPEGGKQQRKPEVRRQQRKPETRKQQRKPEVRSQEGKPFKPSNTRGKGPTQPASKPQEDAYKQSRRRHRKYSYSHKRPQRDSSSSEEEASYKPSKPFEELIREQLLRSQDQQQRGGISRPIGQRQQQLQQQRARASKPAAGQQQRQYKNPMSRAEIVNIENITPRQMKVPNPFQSSKTPNPSPAQQQFSSSADLTNRIENNQVPSKAASSISYASYDSLSYYSEDDSAEGQENNDNKGAEQQQQQVTKNVSVQDQGNNKSSEESDKSSEEQEESDKSSEDKRQIDNAIAQLIPYVDHGKIVKDIQVRLKTPQPDTGIGKPWQSDLLLENENENDDDELEQQFLKKERPVPSMSSVPLGHPLITKKAPTPTMGRPIEKSNQNKNRTPTSDSDEFSPSQQEEEFDQEYILMDKARHGNHVAASATPISPSPTSTPTVLPTLNPRCGPPWKVCCDSWWCATPTTTSTTGTTTV